LANGIYKSGATYLPVQRATHQILGTPLEAAGLLVASTCLIATIYLQKRNTATVSTSTAHHFNNKHNGLIET
jgi:hypothetical protein